MKPESVIEAKYFTKPFSELTNKYPILKSYLISINPPKFDLGNPKILSLINKYLYKEVVNLEVSVPQNYLIPSLGIRYAYCEYIVSTIKTNYPLIEIGTGASAAISMILASVYNKNVLATEINEDSFHSALRNIEINQLNNSINLLKSKGEILHDLIPKGNYSGLLCYPPIYTNDKTILAKKRGWKGKETELFGGGEEGLDFALQLIEEALNNNDICIEVISLMLLKKEQVKILIRNIPKKRKKHYIEIIAGTRKRYVVIIK